ncbi:MAG: hypothetical protein HC905_28595, partial [Bacteroidales bacterium]|nr:hypothetical protein [Bacteroidales bacterium]
MRELLIILFLNVFIIFNGIGQEVSCNELLNYVQQNGTLKGTVSSFQLSESKWLKSVTAYTIDNSIVVIA